MKKLNKIFFNITRISLILLSTSFLLAQETEIDKQITKILNASPEQKKHLIKKLKLEISNIRYDDNTHTTKGEKNTSLDAKIKKRKECSFDMKCGSSKCGNN